MNRVSRPSLRILPSTPLRLPRPRRWLWLGFPLAAWGCAQVPVPVALPEAAPLVVRASAEQLPPPRSSTPATPAAREPAAPKLVPISLDAIFRLAEAQNARLSQARAKVEESASQKSEADKNWLPDVFVGPSYFRHEGGIQDFNGR